MLEVARPTNMANEDDLRPPPQQVAWNDHNVYVIGAGFSKDAGLPVVDEFFNRTRDSVQWLKDNHFMSEAEAVQRVLHFRLQAAAAALRVDLNVETSNSFSVWWLPRRIPATRS